MQAKVFAILSVVIFGLAISGCNTLHGLGKDIRITGEQLEKASGGAGRGD